MNQRFYMTRHRTKVNVSLYMLTAAVRCLYRSSPITRDVPLPAFCSQSGRNPIQFTLLLAELFTDTNHGFVKWLWCILLSLENKRIHQPLSFGMFFYLNINFSKRTAFTFFDCTSFSWGLAETAAAWRELFAKASFKFLTMTSERGVFSFLVPWLEPSGVSRIASASYIYMGRKGKGKE